MATIRLPRAEKKNHTPLLLGLTRGLLAAAIFFVPLFVIPGLTDLQELPKATLFLILTLGAAVVWTLAWIMSGTLSWRRIPAWPAIVTFVVAVLISLVGSVSRTTSLFGLSGYIHDTAPMLLGGVLFLVLGFQVFDHEHDSRNIMHIMMASLGFTGLQAILQVAGVSPLPFPSLQAPQFLVIGNSSIAFSALMALLVILSISTFHVTRSLVWRILTGVSGLIGLLVLLAVDATAGWVTLIAGVAVTLIVASVQPLPRMKLMLSGVVIAIGIVGLLVTTSGIFRSTVVQDLALDGHTSWSVVSATIRHMPIIGSGPATFYYDFLHYRPAAFNQTALAAYSFVKGADAAMTLFSMLGVLGAGALLAVIGWVIMRFLRSFDRLNKKSSAEWEVIATSFGVFVAMLTAMFFAPGMVSLVVIFWIVLMIGMLVVSSREPAWVLRAPITRTLGTVTFLVMALGLVVFIVWPTRMILADRELVNVSAAVQRTEDLSLVVGRIDRAIRLAPQNPVPYFFRAQAELIQGQLAISQQKNDDATAAFGKAIRDGQAGVAHDPKNAVLYSTLGSIYKAVGSFTGGTSDLVRGVYTQAAQLDPNNAKVHIDLGQALYLIAAATKAQPSTTQDDVPGLISQAQSEFETAVRLDSRNPDAIFGLVLVDEINGKNDDAFTRLSALVQDNPQSPALHYELGVRQHNRKDDANAKLSLNAALALDPTFAPAHVELGKIAETAGDTKTARTEYQTALQLDSTNQDAQTALDALPKT